MRKILAIFLLALLAACGSDSDISGSGVVQGVTDSSGSTDGGNGQAATNGSTPSSDNGTADDAQEAAFLADAYQFAIGELALAGLATEKASSDNVRLLAQRLLAQQPYLIGQIGALATQQGVALPSEPTDDVKQALEALAPLSGTDFDRAYANGVATRHQQYVTSYGERAYASTSSSSSDTGDNNDNGAQTFASDALPAQQLNLQAATTLAGVLDPTTFLSNAYQQGLSEIALSQLALERSENGQVQAYAQQMISDHTMANQQISAQAQANSVSLPQAPNPAQQALAQRLAQLSGADFDKAYMNHNVLAHEVAVAQAQEQAQAGSASPVSGLAAALEPVLRMHREQAESLYAQITPTPLFAAFDTALGEVMLAQLALQETDDAQVQQLATNLLQAYSTAKSDARQLANEAGQGLPPEPPADTARAYVALSQVPEQEFAGMFLELNTQLQQMAQDRLMMAQTDMAAVRSFIDGLLPTLRQQIDAALALQQGGQQ